MIRVYKAIEGKTNHDGSVLPTVLITAEERYGASGNFSDTLEDIICDNRTLNTNLKDIIFDSYIQIHVIKDNNPLALYEWARTAFPEEFV